MNASASVPPPLPPEALPASPAKTLRRLFLTLFLRGRSSRGLQKEGAPKSVGQKLALALFFYALFGGFAALALLHRPVFVLSLSLHGLIFVFLGMFVASSAGEVLFNKKEGDILLHRPISPKTLLWAKIRVLVEVSIWLAGAFNLVGFFVGLAAPDGGWQFPVVHIVSTCLEALFCTGCVVLVYQLCLRWFGRERLEGLMTMAQVVISVTAVLAGQLVPRLIGEFGDKIHFDVDSWWIGLLPPAWFAAFDDAIGGSSAPGSWLLMAIGLIATAIVLWLAFGKLARDYEAGLQMLNETTSAPRRKGVNGRRWIDKLVNTPPLSWWLRDPVARASFLLTAAYLVRDRDVKLRVYPGIAPMLVMPLIFMVQGHGRHGDSGFNGFGIAFAGSYIGLIPLLGLNLLRYSQQWQAADIFRAAPLLGPAALCLGARQAVMCFLTFPLLVCFGALAWFVHDNNAQLFLLLPGMVALPVYALIPCIGGKAAPLSVPTEEAKSANRGLSMIGVMLISFALSGVATWSWSQSQGLFWWLLGAETVFVVIIYLSIRATLARTCWSPME